MMKPQRYNYEVSNMKGTHMFIADLLSVSVSRDMQPKPDMEENMVLHVYVAVAELPASFWHTCSSAAEGTGVLGEKIIDGREAEPHSRPYMAYLKIQRSEGFFKCGGVIIHPRFILSAAHCSGENITVILGAHDLLKIETSWQKILVKKIIVHEKYKKKTHENDIMLLELWHKATWTPEVQPIKIPDAAVDVQPNTSCSVAGWGKTNNNSTSNKVLREVNVKVQDVNECKAAKKNNLKEKVICARGTGIKGTCNGDSGSPLICPIKGAHLAAVGIVSFRLSNEKECEDPDRNNVYMKVSAYWSWIKKNIRANSQTCQPHTCAAWKRPALCTADVPRIAQRPSEVPRSAISHPIGVRNARQGRRLDDSPAFAVTVQTAVGTSTDLASGRLEALRDGIQEVSPRPCDMQPTGVGRTRLCIGFAGGDFLDPRRRLECADPDNEAGRQR
ncbi:MCT1A protease, partial [Polypterus senegalus]